MPKRESTADLCYNLRKMQSIHIPSTRAVRTFSELLSRAAFAGETFVIQRYGRALAVLAPVTPEAGEPTADPEPTPSCENIPTTQE